jgi:hypothetical protein
VKNLISDEQHRKLETLLAEDSVADEKEQGLFANSTFYKRLPKLKA